MELENNEDKISLFARFRHNVENLLSHRQKRSIVQESSETETDEKNQNYATKLSENLLTESLNGHKLRNVAKKVARLNPKTDQITAEILKQFCPKINCTEENEQVEINHDFPLLDNKGENETKLEFRGEPLIETVYVCEDYGKTLI